MKIDAILHNAQFITCDEETPETTKIGLWNGQIVGVGSEVDGMTAPATIDLDGAIVTPGFNDIHSHSVWFGLSKTELDFSAVKTVEELYSVLRHGASESSQEWVLGAGLELMNLPQQPALEELDDASCDKNIFIKANSGHSGLVNSQVLDQMKNSSHYSEENAKGIVHDVAGKPTGLVEENALRLVQDLYMPYPLAKVEDALDTATSIYAEQGLTSVTDAGIAGGWIGNNPIEFAAYQKALEAGRLSTRMSPMITMDALVPLLEQQRGIPAGIRTGLGNDFLRISSVKIFVDGSLLGRTAAMTEPYCYCAPEKRGYLQADESQIVLQALEAASAGWSLAMHAIGDAALDIVLEIIEQAIKINPAPALPHRIEHGGYVREDQLQRIIDSGTVLVPQPHFIYSLGDGMMQLLGPKRVPYSYPASSILEAGGILPGSSDRPVADGRPLRVMQSFVERTTESGAVYGANERISAEQALLAYTVGSAQATGVERRLGKIRTSYLADFTVLSDNPLTVPSHKISEINVLGTVMNGRPTFDGQSMLQELNP